MTHEPEPTADTSNSNPWGDPRVRIAFLNTTIFLAAGLIASGHPQVLTVDATHLPIGLALVAGFALSEKLIFHVEARSEAVSYTPTELALAVGLIFLHPGELIVARLLGATIGVLAWRRQPLFKFAFNLANFALTKNETQTEVVNVAEALELLEQVDEDCALLVKLRYFVGLSMKEAAEVLNTSLRTAERNWAYARAWLKSRI